MEMHDFDWAIEKLKLSKLALVVHLRNFNSLILSNRYSATTVKCLTRHAEWWSILSLLVLYLVHVRYNTHLRKVPGPFLASFTRLWKVATIWTARQEAVFMDLHKKLGPLVRIGPNEVSIADPAALKLIYGAGSKFSKSSWYPPWNLAGKSRKFDIFADPHIESHNASKRLISNSYAMNSIVELDAYVQRPVDLLLARMDKFAESGKSMNFSDWMQWFAFDVMGEISFSKQFGFLEQSKDIDHTLQSIDTFLWSGITIAELPELYDISQSKWFRMIPIVGSYGNKLSYLITTALTYIGERKSGATTDRKDLLSRFFNIQKSHPGKFDDLDVQILATVNILAGSDTTSIALRAVLYYLMTNDRVCAKLLDELKTAEEQGTLSLKARYSEAQKLPYLQACIKEAMRLHPSLGTQHLRVVPEGGAIIAGKHLSSGTVVGINAWVMHSQKSVYGEDAELYRPERWLEEGRGEMERHFMSFGYGAHVCLGKNIALLEITKVVPQIVRRFEMKLAHPEDGGWSLTSHTFVQQRDFDVVLHRRKRTIEVSGVLSESTS